MYYSPPFNFAALCNASLQDSSECVAALKVNTDQKNGWFSQKATSMVQAVVENLVFSVENVSIKFREFEFSIGSIVFVPTMPDPDAKFTKKGIIKELAIRCSATGPDAKPVLELQEIDFTMMKGNSGAFKMHLHFCSAVAVEAQPIALKLGLCALSGSSLSCFF